jgi:hypothetical protein
MVKKLKEWVDGNEDCTLRLDYMTKADTTNSKMYSPNLPSHTLNSKRRAEKTCIWRRTGKNLLS